MRSVEMSARKREDAINKALEELGIERHDAHVEILDEGSPGFLGIGVRDVTVRVSTEVPGQGGYPIEADGNRVDAANRAKRQDHGRTGRDGDKNRPRRGRGGNGDRGPRAQGGRKNEPQARDRRDRDKGGKRGGDRDRDRPARAPQAGGRSGKPNRRQNEKKTVQPKRPREERPRPAPKPRPPAKVLTDARSNEAAALLQGIIENMGIESTVQPVETDQGGLKLAVQSPDSALLIGRKGRNLAAMQYLLNRIFGRQDEERQAERIIVDVEGYLDRRRDTLEDMALRLADRAKATGRRMRVKPLSPQERRIVHMALHDDADIRTFSVGESNYRSVIIAPVTEGDAEEEDNGYDYPEDFDETAGNGAAEEMSDDLDNGFDEDMDAEEEDVAQKHEGKTPHSQEPAPSEEDEVEQPDEPETTVTAEDADRLEEEEEDSGEEDLAGAKRFRPKRAVSRRGTIRKRRPQKPLAPVSTGDEPASGQESKEDTSGDSDSS